MTSLLPWLRWLAGPVAAATLWLIPLDLPLNAQLLAGLMAWVVLWWIFEPIAIPATGLLGVSLAVILGISGATKAFSPFAHPLIFLFFGGFLLARAMAVHGLDRRIALLLLTRSFIRGRPWRMIAALFAVTAFLSMWISNTATTAMLLPIALGVMATIRPGRDTESETVLLGVAYASSVGGVATPVGSPPNVIALGMLDRLAGIRVSFLEWMMLAVPIALAALTFLLFISRRRLPELPKEQAEGNSEYLSDEYRKLGPLSPGERNVLIAASTAVFLWVGPSLVSLLLPGEHPAAAWLANRIPEAVAAVLAASLLFILPVRSPGGAGSGPTLEWKDAVRIDWGSLLLFGAGLSLGVMMFDTGLAGVLGEALIGAAARTSADWAFWVFTAAAVFFAVFFTETTSNTATANMLIPLIIGAAAKSGFDPVIPAIGVAMACSFAFMLPVSTPPNAIVYGSGLVRIQRMVRSGFAMNLACTLIVLGGLAIFSLLRE